MHEVRAMLENLRKLRTEAGVTQKQLADAISVSQQSINKYENHNIEPDIQTMILIADFFHTSVDYLIGHDTEPPRLSADDHRLLDEYHRLSKQQRQCVRMVMQSYLE